MTEYVESQRKDLGAEKRSPWLIAAAVLVVAIIVKILIVHHPAVTTVLGCVVLAFGLLTKPIRHVKEGYVWITANAWKVDIGDPDFLSKARHMRRALMGILKDATFFKEGEFTPLGNSRLKALFSVDDKEDRKVRVSKIRSEFVGMVGQGSTSYDHENAVAHAVRQISWSSISGFTERKAGWHLYFPYIWEVDVVTLALTPRELNPEVQEVLSRDSIPSGVDHRTTAAITNPVAFWIRGCFLKGENEEGGWLAFTVDRLHTLFTEIGGNVTSDILNRLSKTDLMRMFTKPEPGKTIPGTGKKDVIDELKRLLATYTIDDTKCDQVLASLEEFECKVKAVKMEKVPITITGWEWNDSTKRWVQKKIEGKESRETPFGHKAYHVTPPKEKDQSGKGATPEPVYQDFFYFVDRQQVRVLRIPNEGMLRELNDWEFQLRGYRIEQINPLPFVPPKDMVAAKTRQTVARIDREASFDRAAEQTRLIMAQVKAGANPTVLQAIEAAGRHLAPVLRALGDRANKKPTTPRKREGGGGNE